jgi:hypothetical protein
VYELLDSKDCGLVCAEIIDKNLLIAKNKFGLFVNEPFSGAINDSNISNIIFCTVNLPMVYSA